MLDEEFFSVAEVAEKLRVTKAAVYKWMQAGRLEYVYVGDDRRVTRAALEAFIMQSTQIGRKEEEEKKASPELEQPVAA